VAPEKPANQVVLTATDPIVRPCWFCVTCVTAGKKRLREELATAGTVHQVVIDEVQKVPQLLDEVHWLLENRRIERVNMDFTLS